MQLSLKIAMVLSVFVSSQLFAAATLVVPEDVKLLAVNMEKPKLEGGLFSAEKTINIPDGMNQIIFQYRPNFEIGDDVKSAYSDVIIAKFDVNNETLKFELPEFKTYRQAQTNISPLEWHLLDSKGLPVSLVEDVLQSDGVQIGRNYPQEARNYNIAGGIAAIAVAYVSVNPQHAVTGVEPTIEVNRTETEDSQMVDLLKTMYQKASPEEQAAFKSWVAQQ